MTDLSPAPFCCPLFDFADLRSVLTVVKPGKSHPWTNTSVGGNFWRTFRTIGPYEFPQEKVRTNAWSIWISPEIGMDQWPSKFSESFSLDRYWSIECSCLPGTFSNQITSVRPSYLPLKTTACNNTLLRRVLRRFSNSKCFLEGCWEAPEKVFSKDKVLRRVLRRERFTEGA